MADRQTKTKKITKINPVKLQVTMQLEPRKCVCAYCRVSTDSREQQNSFTAQTAYYKEMISKREDWQFTGIYADEARSGTKLKKRDDFLRMMQDCEAGKIDIIITKSVTRFARNTVDSIQAIRKLKLLGIAVFFEKENINTLSEHSEQLLTILSSLAQGEAESTSTNNKWAAIKRFQDGTFKIGTPALGYNTDTEGELVIDEQEAETVRYIFKEYLNGKGSYVIAREKPSEQSNWKCKHYIYKNRVHCVCGVITEEQLKQVFLLAVNKVIKTPLLLEKRPKDAPRYYPPEFLKLDQRIKILEEEGGFSSKELAALVFQRAEMLFRTVQVKDYEHQTERMKQALSDKEEESGFNEELFLQIVKQMIIYADGRIDVEFINGLTVNETYKN